MPERLRQTGPPLVIRLVDAPALDPRNGHILGVTPAVGPVVLRVLGLTERLAEAAKASGLSLDAEEARRAASLLFTRVVVHEVLHVFDRREGWSRSRSWRALSDWGLLSLLPTPAPRTGSGDFASPWGARSPAEDLATFAEVALVPGPLGPFDADLAAACRFPTKWAWFIENVGAPPAGPNVRCSPASDVGLDPAHVGDIELLWAAPSLNDAATAGGHLLLEVESLENGGSRREVWSMLADNGNVSPRSPAFAALGLTGGFYGRVMVSPYEATRYRYVESEGRDLVHFAWNLDDAERRVLLERLDDLASHWKRPYLFLEQNCSALIVELANAVEARPIRTPVVVPPDLVVAELVRRGRIRPIPPDPALDLSSATRSRMVSGALRATSEVCGAPASGISSPNLAQRRAAFTALAARAIEKSDPGCWAEAARAWALAEPLGEASGRESLSTALREEAPAAVRAAALGDVNSAVVSAWSLATPASGSAAHTPYEPMKFGTSVELHDFSPSIYVQRSAIGLERHEPRRFGPARGVDMRLLDTRVELRLQSTPSVTAAHTVLDAAWHPSRPLARLVPGWHLVLGDSWLDTRARAGRARWLTVGGGLDLTPGWANGGVETWLGPSVVTEFTAVEPLLATRTWFELPWRTRFDAWSTGPAGLGITTRAALIPAVSTQGATRLIAEGGVLTGVYVGDVFDTAVRLELEGDFEGALVGSGVTRGARLSVGVRLQPW